jgi:hypothetical protein
MENGDNSLVKGERNKPSVLIRIVFAIYGIFFWLGLVFQIYYSALTWIDTVTNDYFCGNPLMGYWVQWFVASVIVGVIILPGFLRSIRRRKEITAKLYLLGSLLYVLSVIVMLIFGIVQGTVPELIFYFGYVF